MNLSKLFETQRVLDARIMEKHPELIGQDNLPWKILALQVELGECANEWRGFKKWSNDQEPRIKGYSHHEEGHVNGGFYSVPRYDKNPLLEEYVDCLHFILSIGLELGFENVWINHSTIKHVIKHDDVLVNFSTVFAFVYKLERRKSFNWYDSLFERFIVLGFSLGFTWEQIEQGYFKKNAINHTRQNTGY